MPWYYIEFQDTYGNVGMDNGYGVKLLAPTPQTALNIAIPTLAAMLKIPENHLRATHHPLITDDDVTNYDIVTSIYVGIL